MAGGTGQGENVEDHQNEKEEVNVLIKKKKKPQETGTIPPPDGGWGWMVVAAGFMCNMVLDGIGYSFGILLTPLIEHYGASNGVMSMVGSILTGVILLSGPIAAAIVNKFGTRCLT